MVGIGLFKTQGLDEYGTAAVGWLWGAGLKATEGAGGAPGEEGSKRSLALSAMNNTHGSHGHRQNNLSHEQQQSSSQHTKFPSHDITEMGAKKLHLGNNEDNKET